MLNEKINKFSDSIISYVPEPFKNVVAQQVEGLKEQLIKSLKKPDNFTPKEQETALAGYLETYRIEPKEKPSNTDIHDEAFQEIDIPAIKTSKPTGNTQMCPHNRKKACYKDCGGSQICPHNRQKAYCKDCGGSQICPHNRRKEQCKDCGRIKNMPPQPP